MVGTLIIGGGAIGLSVAYHLAKRGADDVTVLERNQLTSGTSWHAAGIVGPLRATPNMTRLAMAALDVFPELEAETGMSTGYLRTGGYWLAREVERLDELYRIADLGATQGLSPRMILPGEVPVDLLDLSAHVGALHVPEDANVNPVDLCMAYARGARNRGVRIREGIGVERLLVNRNRITGAALDDGTQIPADRVVIATGGFEWDAEMRQTFLRGPVTAPASPPTASGGGLKLAMAAGAKLGNMTSAWWAPTLVTPDAPWASGEQRAQIILIERTVPHSIMVNRSARRFCNEAANYSALGGVFHQFDPANYDYLNLPAYLIFDAQYAARYPLGTRQPGQPIPDWVMRADTLEALAQQIGLEGGALTDTVARFNVHADAGHDPDFGRGTSAYDHFYGDRSRSGAAVTLGAIREAPFYAVEIHSGLLGTNGGPRTDGQAHILGHDGAPIPGLLGAGNAIACPTGGIYAGAGGTLGPALTLGYLAGRAAAAANT